MADPLDFDWMSTAPDAVIANLILAWFGEHPSAAEIARWRARFMKTARRLANRRRALAAENRVSNHKDPQQRLLMEESSDPSGDEIVCDILGSPEMMVLINLARSIQDVGSDFFRALEICAQQRATNRMIDESRAKLPGYYYDKTRHVARDIIAYADTKLSGAPLPESARWLPRTARAVMNASTPEHLKKLRDEAFAARFEPRHRSRLFRRLHAEGTEILLTPPDLSRCEPGMPRGVWPPPPPPPEPEPELEGGAGAPPAAVQ
jgi:hypothetical protein